MKTLNIVLFEDFTCLDALGPAEVFGRLSNDYSIKYRSLTGGLVKGSSGVEILTSPIAEISENDILVVPGGLGTRKQVFNEELLNAIKELEKSATTVLSICTGAALIAAAGLLENKCATTNKNAWNWATNHGKKVNWIKKARWVVDGKIYTSSGITAGIDMALGYIADNLGIHKAKEIAQSLEYIWNDDKNDDPFSIKEN